MSIDLDTSEKIISIIAGAIAILTFIFFRRKSSRVIIKETNVDRYHNNSSNTSTNNNVLTVNIPNPNSDTPGHSTPAPDMSNVPHLKRSVRVLFIDDDKDFKIVKVLKKMGWEYVKIVTDLNSLEHPALIEATVVFVDIQGVGRSMQCSDEGLGLTLAIKGRHPDKKIIIYSSQEEGTRFHDAFHASSYSLPKAADPIRFEDAIVRALKNG